MRKTLIIMALIFCLGYLFAQQNTNVVEQATKQGADRAKQNFIQAGQEDTVAEAMKPSTSVTYGKLPTPVEPYYSRFNRNFIRTTNKVLLNKWLKESK